MPGTASAAAVATTVAARSAAAASAGAAPFLAGTSRLAICPLRICTPQQVMVVGA